MYSYCNIEGATDVGCCRRANEDWLGHFECKNGLVAVVCDGMGGHAGGEVASHLAVETIQRFLEENYFDNPFQAIVQACNAANAAILQRAAAQPELQGMGATCVMLIVRDGKVYIGSVGDSRIYLARSKRLVQLTKDQSFVQTLVDAGEITPEQAEHHPRKNEITNALGLPNMQPATVLDSPINPEAGDCFILCSDGLSGMVPDRHILKIASDQARMNQRDRVNTLIALARKNGGHDNITCMIVEFSVTPGAPSSKPASAARQETTAKDFKPNIGKIAMLAAIAFFALIALGFGGWGIYKLFSDKLTPEQQEYVDVKNDKTIETETKEGINLVYIPDTEFMRITENSDYHALDVVVVSYTGEKLDSKEFKILNTSLDSLTLYPKQNIKSKRTINPEHERVLILSFNSEPFTPGEDVGILYSDENAKRHLVLIKVDVPENDELAQEFAEKQKDGLTTLFDKTRDNKPKEKVHDCTVKVKSSGQPATITLSYDPKKNSTDTLVYTPLPIILGEKSIGSWYGVTYVAGEDGKPESVKCNLVITPGLMPKDPKDCIITIPLEGGKCIIRVKREENQEP